MSARTSTHQKALAVNLDPSTYGTLAEIGAGQEVARWFFRVGGAAGTIAKTVSAYDMTVSDDLYGPVQRYVSRARLEAMLAHEWRHLVEELGPVRGERTRFFVFADTVSARDHEGTNECHGWVGLRFQGEPGGAPSDLLLHLHLLDPTNLHQQEAVGVLGVNLIHAAFFHRDGGRPPLEHLRDGLSLDRVELDFVHASGPAFADAPPTAVGAALVTGALARAVLLERGGGLLPPTDVLHKRPTLLARGRLTLPDAVYTHLLRAGLAAFDAELAGRAAAPIALLETSVVSVESDAELAGEVLAARLQTALRLAPHVLVTRFGPAWELTHYLRRYTRAPVRFVVGAEGLRRLLEARYYEALPGGVLEGIGKLLADNVRLYVCPMEGPRGERLSAHDLAIEGPLRHLHRYLLELGWLVPIAAGLERP